MGVPKQTPQHSQSTGPTIVLVTVAAISADGTTALCTSRTGIQYNVPYLVQPGKGVLPQVGENWYISNTTGVWLFVTFVGTNVDEFPVIGGGGGGGGGEPTGPATAALATFVYNGTPAAGNEPVAYVSATGDDPYGNDVVGLASFGSPSKITVGTDGTLTFFSANGNVLGAMAPITGTYTEGINLFEMPLLCYDGEPTTGNLVISLAGVAGVDKYGNHYAAGLNASIGSIPGGIVTGTVPGSTIPIGAGSVLDYNPYFQNGDLTGWVVYPFPPANTLSDTQTAPKGPYPWSAKIVSGSTGSAELEGQGFPFQISLNTQYLVTCWVYVDVPGATTIRIGMDFLNGPTAGIDYVSTITQTFSVPGNTWTPLTFVVTSPSSGVTYAYPRVGPLVSTGAGMQTYVQALLVLPQVPGGLVQAGTITAAQIAAGTITAAQIAAGTVIAGVVDGTTIQGATIEGNSFLLYEGAPGPGNLIGSTSGLGGTDTFGNNYSPGFILGIAGTGQIQLQPYVGQAFNIQNALSGTFGAMAQYYTGDANQLMPSMLGSLLFGSGASASMASVFHSPFGNTAQGGAAIILQAENDNSTFGAVTYIGTVTLSSDGVTMIFTPIALFAQYAFVLYAGGGSQVVVTEMTPGSGTIPIPAGVSTAKIETWAAGAGSGGTQGFGGGGGGGGEYACEPALAVTTAGVGYTVGSGGAAGPGNGNGGAGGNSTANNNLGTGGGAGNGIVTAHGGTAGQYLGSPSAPGGSGSINTIHFNGGTGAGSGNAIGDGGGGGGGSAGPTSAGNAGATSTGQPGGGGGAAVSGGGRGGNGGYGHPHAGGNAGQVGGPPGGGAGGPGGNGVGGGEVGEPGANGQVRVTYTTGSITVGCQINAGATFTDAFGNSIIGAGLNYPNGTGPHFGVDGNAQIYIASASNQYTTITPEQSAPKITTAAGGGAVGLAGYMPVAPAADFTIFTITAASNTQASKSWTIPGGDAQVGTTYRLTAVGAGVQGSTAQNLGFSFLNGDAFGNMTSTLAGASGTFQWKCVLEVTVISTGTSGTANWSMQATAGGLAGADTNGFTNAGAFNTVTGVSIALGVRWGSTTGGPTMTCYQSYIERLGP